MTKRNITLTAALVTLIGVALYFGLARSSQKRTGEQTEIVQATIGSIGETVEATGGVEPLNRVEVKPPISGRIEKLLVNEGDRVRAGTVLAWMSSSDRAAIIDAARAHGPDEVKRWEDSYKPTPIIAPLSGAIILRNVVVGQTVDTSSILFAMSDRLIVRANVDETDIGRVKPGMPATITLDSYPDQPIDGVVFQILYEGKNVSNVITYGVKIEPKNVPPFFRSQMTANISLLASRKENVLILPSAAVQTSGDQRQVLIPGPDGKPIARPVEVGIETGDQVEIVSGLAEGDKVLMVRRRYTPQAQAASSPLVMGGNRNQGQQQSGVSRRRQ